MLADENTSTTLMHVDGGRLFVLHELVDQGRYPFDKLLFAAFFNWLLTV